MDTPSGRPRPAPRAPAAEPAVVVAEAAPAPVIVARAEEVSGDRMPRLVASGDGDLEADAPQVLSETTPLSPAAPKGFAPRLLASGDGTPTSLPVMSASPQTAAPVAAGNFMPRLITSGRDEHSRHRRERPVEAAAPIEQAAAMPAVVAALAAAEVMPESAPEAPVAIDSGIEGEQDNQQS